MITARAKYLTWQQPSAIYQKETFSYKEPFPHQHTQRQQLHLLVTQTRTGISNKTHE